MSQLALPLKLDDHAVFDSFHDAGNEALVHFLIQLVAASDGPGGWIWGAAATGKSHLLQAFCERAGDRAFYLPLNESAATGAGILDGLASRHFVCLDDVGLVAGNPDWEEGLFDLFNQLTDSAGVLLVTATSPVRECNFQLADLESRFSRLPAFRVQPLDDQGRIRALQLRAKHRGLDLPLETAQFLLNRSKRDMASLYRALDTLDAAALRAKRRLTIPFVRDVLAESGRPK